jgi:hypothetical protein
MEIKEFLKSDNAIYHFTTKETAIEYILNNQNLKFGVFSSTNDPLEYKDRLTGIVGWGWEDKHDKALTEIISLVDDLIKSSLFLSFCMNQFQPFKYAYEKSRMWSQYGGNQSGVCLVFSKEQFEKDIKLEYSEKVYCEKISYFESPDDFKYNVVSVDGADLENKGIDEIANSYLEEYNKKFLFQKQADYKDENEYRVVVLNDKKASEQYFDIKKSLKYILLGDSFPKVYYELIKSQADKIGAVCKRVHWERNQYYLLDIKEY